MDADLTTVEGCLGVLRSDEPAALDVVATQMCDAVARLRDAGDAKTRLLRPCAERLASLLGCLAEEDKEDVVAVPALDEQQTIALVRSLVAVRFGVGYDECSSARSRLARALLRLWAAHPSDAVRVAALLGIHGLAGRYVRGGAMLSSLVGSMFRLYADACRVLSAHTLGRASLLAAGIVEVLLAHPERAADLALPKLRALASDVSAALRKPGSAGGAATWSVVARLRVFAHLVESAGERGGRAMGALSERVRGPLARVLLALCAHAPGVPRLFPFQLHVAATAASVCGSGARALVLPVCGVLLRIAGHALRQPLWRLPAGTKAFDLGALCRVSAADAASRPFLEAAADDALHLLVSLVARHARAPYLPELAAPVVARLRDISARTGSADRVLRSHVLAHAAKLEAASAAVAERRRALGLTPAMVGRGLGDAPGLDALGAYAEALGRVRLAKRRMLLDGAAELAAECLDEDEPGDSVGESAGADDGHSGDEDALDVVLGASKAKKRRLESRAKTSRGEKKTKRSPSVQDDDARTDDILEDFVVSD